MMLDKLRIACTALGNRIYLGKVDKTGLSFSGTTKDVTSDCLKSVMDFVKVGNEAVVREAGVPKFRIRVTAISPEEGAELLAKEARQF